MYPSNNYDINIHITGINIEIEKLIKLRELLIELKERRKSKHDVITCKTVKGKIIEVLCSCGKLTKYKKPLNSIEDFECPSKE